MVCIYHLNRIYIIRKTPSHDTTSEGTISMRCLISGRSIILPSHATGDDEFSVIVFDDTQDNKRLIDGDLVKVVYRNTSEDVMVCKYGSDGKYIPFSVYL